MNLRRILKQDEELGSNRSGDDGRAICWRMNERKIRPIELAEKTGYSLSYINRVISGIPLKIELGFLQKCVLAFQLSSTTSGRSKVFGNTKKTIRNQNG